MSPPTPPAKMPSVVLRGGRFIMSFSPFSMLNASAGKESVTRLIHNRCTGFKIVKPMRFAKKIAKTSLKLEASRNWMDLRMLS